MKMPTIIMIWIVVSILTMLVLFFKDKDVKKEETYIVSSSKWLIIFFGILTILLSIFTVYFFLHIKLHNGSKDEWYAVVMGLVFTIASFYVYIDILKSKVIVEKNKFIVKKLFSKETTYYFNDLTSYIDIDYNTPESFEIFVYDKKILTVTQWENGYEEFKNKVKKYINKNAITIPKTYKVFCGFPENMYYLLLTIIIGIINYFMIKDYYFFGSLGGLEFLYFKGGEIILILSIAFILSILMWIKQLGENLCVYNDKIVHTKFFFVKNTYYYKDIIYRLSDETDIQKTNMKIYYKNHSKKIIAISSYYKNKTILIKTLKIKKVKRDIL